LKIGRDIQRVRRSQVPGERRTGRARGHDLVVHGELKTGRIRRDRNLRGR
jgi:hypothetical protein